MKSQFFLLFTFIQLNICFAQFPCSPTSGGIPATENFPGCVMCSSVYQGSSAGYNPTNSFSCGVPDGTQWLTVASDDQGRIIIELLVENCTGNEGLEFVLFDNNMIEVSCYVNTGGLENYVILNLLPNTDYSVMFDGINGDICDFTMILPNNYLYPPTAVTGPITADPDTTYCPGSSACFSIDPVFNATRYDWEVPNHVTITSGGGPNDIFVCVDFNSPGGGVFRVVPSNPCHNGVPVLKTTVTVPIPPSFWPPIFVCPNEMPFDTVFKGISYSFEQYGSAMIPFITALGCDSNINITIIPKIQIPAIIDTTICNGDCVVIGDSCYSETGNQVITLTDSMYLQSNGCDSIVNLIIRNLEPVSFVLPPDMLGCAPNSTVVLDGTGSSSGANISYEWSGFSGGTLVSGEFTNIATVNAPGLYALAVIETVSSGEPSCVALDTVEVIQISQSLSAPIIICDPTTTSITFGWNPVPGALSYSIVVDGTTMPDQTSTIFSINNLNPGDIAVIEVVANGDNGCFSIPTISTCTAQNCPIVTINIPPVDDFCLMAGYQPVMLTALTSSSVSGTFVWSGNGVSPDGTFDPQVAGVGTHVLTVTYTEGNCTYSATIEVVVHANPTSDFIINSPICQGETTMITYNGSASNNANFNWDFGNGMVVSGSNSGPYAVSFSDSGINDVSLEVEENECVSTLTANSVEVNPQLIPITISCGTASVSEVSFAWNLDSNVQFYQVQVTTGQTGVLSGNTFTVSGLSPGEEVEIEVEGNSGTNCPSSFGSVRCQAQNCTPVNITIADVSDVICAGDETEIQLFATNDSPTQNGTYTWIGPGVSADGKFNSTGFTAGVYTIQVVYTELGCTYQEIVLIRIESNPEISARVNSPIWFIGGSSGSIDLTVANGLPPYTVIGSNGSSTTTLDSLAPGEYCFMATDQNSCSAEECFEVRNGTYFVSPIQIICEGDRQPLSVTPETGATFSWSPALGLSCSDCASPFADPRKTTIYTVTATLPDGRSGSQNVVVLVLPSFICNFSPLEIDENFLHLTEGIDVENFSKDDIESLENEIIDFYLNKEVVVAPNPTNGNVQILTSGEIESVELFDISDRKMDAFFKNEIDLQNFPNGIYLLKIKVDERVIVRRIIKMN